VGNAFSRLGDCVAEVGISARAALEEHYSLVVRTQNLPCIEDALTAAVVEHRIEALRPCLPQTVVVASRDAVLGPGVEAFSKTG
jgi:hypothetical protein